MVEKKNDQREHCTCFVEWKTGEMASPVRMAARTLEQEKVTTDL